MQSTETFVWKGANKTCLLNTNFAESYSAWFFTILRSNFNGCGDVQYYYYYVGYIKYYLFKY